MKISVVKSALMLGVAFGSVVGGSAAFAQAAPVQDQATQAAPEEGLGDIVVTADVTVCSGGGRSSTEYENRWS